MKYPVGSGKLSRSYTAYLFLIPWFIGFFGLNLLPMAASLFLSFTNYNIFDPPRFDGFSNFIYMFTNDWHFPAAVSVTVRYVFFSVPLQLCASLILAFLLNQKIKGLTLYRTLFYIPSLLGSSVAVGILWRQIFSSDGLLNIFLQKLGLMQEGGISWIGDPRYALWTMIILRIWQFGSPMIIFLAALKQIPQEILEASEIDGARRLQRVWRIILPMISPIILFNFIMQIISAFKVFTEAFIISGGAVGGGVVGGTLDSLLFYTIHIYSEGFLKFRMGYASALSWVLLLMVALLTWIAFRISSRLVHYE
ncbi:sugar ABC transporter permease [Marispirochaeta aestuarii]|uniref:carbohydrate ABC transporter permease n=1 Tax=Marispirochaeta aestuarii TaxID=1963862 RepID=UPI0029C980B5|nr:sugar ABC transporter permease [Marispirochaeta aestuarii]